MRLAVFAAPALLLAALAGITGVACDTGSPASPSTMPPVGLPGDAAPAGGDGGDASVVPRGARLLGIGTDRRSATYPSDLATTTDAGATLTSVEVAWSEVETPYDAGDGDAAATSVFEPTLHIAGLVAPTLRAGAVLELDVTEDRARLVPEDLRAAAWDDPALVARFVAAQDYVLEQTRELDVAAYVIGSRVDLELDVSAADAGAFGAFASFYVQAATAARARRPGLRVGVSVSPAALGTHAVDLAAVWNASDVVVTRLDPPFPSGSPPVTPAPAAVAAGLERAARTAPAGKPLFVLGVAYPSAAGADAQTAFVHDAFRAWDVHASTIAALVFTRLDDPTEAAARAAALRLGRSDDAAVGALRTLGLRDDAKRPKPALGAVGSEARARGF